VIDLNRPDIVFDTGRPARPNLTTQPGDPRSPAGPTGSAGGDTRPAMFEFSGMRSANQQLRGTVSSDYTVEQSSAADAPQLTAAFQRTADRGREPPRAV